MVEAILKDTKRVMPCAVLCEGEYGLRDVVVGVPVQLGKGGAERIVVYELTAQEQKALELSANAVRELCAAVDRLMASL
jgi:malate dehydrogenase